jgi:hypothetical protein
MASPDISEVSRRREIPPFTPIWEGVSPTLVARLTVCRTNRLHLDAGSGRSPSIGTSRGACESR